jgi:hypothetical protein
MGCKHTCSTSCATAIFAVKRQTISHRDQMQLSLNAFKRCHTAYSHLQHSSNPLQPDRPIQTAMLTSCTMFQHCAIHRLPTNTTSSPPRTCSCIPLQSTLQCQNDQPNSSRTTYTFTQKRTSTSKTQNEYQRNSPTASFANPYTALPSLEAATNTLYICHTSPNQYIYYIPKMDQYSA